MPEKSFGWRSSFQWKTSQRVWSGQRPNSDRRERLQEGMQSVGQRWRRTSERFEGFSGQYHPPLWPSTPSWSIAFVKRRGIHIYRVLYYLQIFLMDKNTLETALCMSSFEIWALGIQDLQHDDNAFSFSDVSLVGIFHCIALPTQMRWLSNPIN